MWFRKISLLLTLGIILSTMVSCDDPGNSKPMTRWLFVTTTYKHTCAIDDLQQGYCWGNLIGNLPQKIPGMQEITSVRIASSSGNIFYVIGTDQSFRRVIREGQSWSSTSFQELSHAMDMSDSTYLINWQSNQRTCVVSMEGPVWCFNEDLNSLEMPTISMVPDLTELVEVDTGAGHECALRQDGTIWCWGRNEVGQLGRDPADGTSGPEQVQGLPTMRTISSFENTSCGISTEGELYCWGRIRSWVTYLCMDNQSGSYLPCDDPDPYSDYQMESHSVDSWQPVQIEGLPGVEQVSWVARDDQGRLWTFMGPDETLPNRVFPDFSDAEFSTGNFGNGCLIRQDQSLWCWGTGPDRLGIGEVEVPCGARSCDYITPVPLRVHEPIN